MSKPDPRPMISRNSSHFSLSPAVSEECEGEDGEVVLRQAAGSGGERLALSGLYLNSSEALKYLTDQLSWVGLRKGSGGGEKEDGDAVASADMNPEAAESTGEEKNQIPGKKLAVSLFKMQK